MNSARADFELEILEIFNSHLNDIRTAGRASCIGNCFLSLEVLFLLLLPRSMTFLVFLLFFVFVVLGWAFFFVLFVNFLLHFLLVFFNTVFFSAFSLYFCVSAVWLSFFIQGFFVISTFFHVFTFTLSINVIVFYSLAPAFVWFWIMFSTSTLRDIAWCSLPGYLKTTIQQSLRFCKQCMIMAWPVGWFLRTHGWYVLYHHVCVVLHFIFWAESLEAIDSVYRQYWGHWPGDARALTYRAGRHVETWFTSLGTAVILVLSLVWGHEAIVPPPPSSHPHPPKTKQISE